MMKISKIKKVSNYYIVSLDNKTNIKLYSDTLIKFNLLKPRLIDNKELDLIIEYNNEIECLDKAIKYINVRLRTKKEIYDKFKDYPKSTIDKVILKLESNGYLNEEVYIEAYLSDAINHSTKGSILIKQELIAKGLNKELIDKHLNKIENDIWIDKAIVLANKKVNSNKKLTNKLLLLNISNYLSSKGYRKDIINIVIDSLELNNDFHLLQSIYEKEYNKLKRKYDGEQLNNKLKYNLYKKGFSCYYSAIP